MRVRMLTSMAGATISRKKGDIYDLPEDKAQRLIDAGFAEPVQGAAQRETAAVKPDEVRHLGGGWYELPNGQRVQGRAEAERVMRESGVNGT